MTAGTWRLASSTNDELKKRCEETAAAKTELSTAARNDSESERRKGITGDATIVNLNKKSTVYCVFF